MKFRLVSVSVLLMIVWGCSEESPSSGLRAPEEFSGITITDERGNVLGGDLSDWQPRYVFTPTGITPGVRPAYPNPTSGGITFTYAVVDSDSVWIEVFDRPGAPAVETIVSERVGARGVKSVTWTAHLPIGLYRVRIKTESGLSAYGDIEIEQ